MHYCIAIAESVCLFANRVLLVLAGILLVAMVCLACLHMLLRAAFTSPLQGTHELMGFAGALVCAFALAATQMRKGHIALTVLAGKFPAAVDRYIDALTNAVCAVFFCLAGKELAAYANSVYRIGELSGDLHIPFYGFVYAVACGCFVLALNLLTDCLKNLANWKPAS